MSEMEYPEDETDLTSEEADDIMADAVEVRLVPEPLYRIVGPAQTFGPSAVTAQPIMPISTNIATTGLVSAPA